MAAENRWQKFLTEKNADNILAPCSRAASVTPGTGDLAFVPRLINVATGGTLNVHPVENAAGVNVSITVNDGAWLDLAVDKILTGGTASGIVIWD
jgi:hypothetical protein